MERIRRLLARVAVGCLVLQLSSFTAAPAAVCAGMSAGSSETKCTCSHCKEAACPMQHGGARHECRKICSCRSTNDTAAAVLLQLFDATAILAARVDTPLPPAAAEPIPSSDSGLSCFFLAPDAPPPRA